MNLPKPLGKRSYNNLQHLLSKKAKEIVTEMINKSAKKIFNIIKTKFPDKMVMNAENEECTKVTSRRHFDEKRPPFIIRCHFCAMKKKRL